jgi:hypothetical protein
LGIPARVAKYASMATEKDENSRTMKEVLN